MSDVFLEVEQRETKGKNANRKLRSAGRIPAVVYGGGRPPVSIQLGEKALRDLLRSTSHESRIFQLRLGSTGQSRHAMVREMVVHPISRKVLHVDFQRIQMDEKIRVAIPIHLTGLPIGVKMEGGVLDFVTRELHVECLPGKIPADVTVDVSALHNGQHLEASSIELPDGVVLTDEPGRVIALVAGVKVTAADAEADALLEGAKAEPEVLTRRKTDD
jgi:large subunit ribosomal protein L25